jgi:hypothetical protein
MISRIKITLNFTYFEHYFGKSNKNALVFAAAEKNK